MLYVGEKAYVEDTDYIVTDMMEIGYETYYLLEDLIHSDNRPKAVAVFYEDIEIDLIVIVGHTWDSLREWAIDFEKGELETRTKQRIEKELSIAYDL